MGGPTRSTIAGDTDSVYFTLNDFVQEEFKNKEASVHEKTDWIDKFVQDKIQPIIEEGISVFARDLNAFDKSVIGADREIIADKAVFAAKKKYFARVIDSEGVRYNPHKMKVVGLEIAKSSTPSYIKKKLKDEALGMILDGSLQEIQQWSKDAKDVFVTQPLDAISKASGVTSIDYELSGKITVPINSRASICYNNYIIAKKLEDRFELVTPGDNIRMVYLVSPNPFNSNIIAFKDVKFIEQFREFVDFDTNFEKNFTSPLEIMTKPAGFNLSQATAELDEW